MSPRDTALASRRARPSDAASQSDGVLVRRVLDGERSAYETLVRRHQARLYRQARGMGLDPDTCEDLVQDAFVGAYQSLAACKDPDRFGVWVYRILRNRCLDHLKDIRRRSVPLDDLTLAATEGLPDREARRARIRRELSTGLEALSPLLRDAFLMKHHLGLEYAEMAEIAGVSTSAMKMRVQRAREELRRTLELRDALEDV